MYHKISFPKTLLVLLKDLQSIDRNEIEYYYYIFEIK